MKTLKLTKSILTREEKNRLISYLEKNMRKVRKKEFSRKASGGI